MRRLRVVAAAFALLAGCSQAKAPEAARALLWKVSDGDNAVYLLGSFHALKPDDYPLPAPVSAAFADAEKLAFEVPPAEMESPALAQQLVASARLPAGQSLADRLSPATWKRLQGYCRRNGIEAANLEGFQPWFVAMSLSLGEMSRQGYDPKLGLDRHLMAQAAQAGKPTLGLETAADQIRVLAGMDLPTQRQMLEEFLDDAEAPEDGTDALHADWRRGDAAALEKSMVVELSAKYAALYRSINVGRNQAWLPKLRAMLDEPGRDDTLVVVGALHLLGRDGLVQQLQAKGYRVERL